MVRAVDTLLEGIRARFEGAFLLGPALNYGDEISALLADPAHAYDVMATLRDSLRPWGGLRCAFVYGQIGTRSEDLTRVSGPVFSRANALIKQLKKSGWFSTWATPDDAANQTLGALANSASAMIASMTNYQFEVYRALASGQSQIEIAAAMGKHQQSVSDAVKRADIDLILSIEQTIRNVLKTATINTAE